MRQWHDTSVADYIEKGRRGAAATRLLRGAKDECPGCGQSFRSLSGHRPHCKGRQPIPPLKNGDRVCMGDECFRTVPKDVKYCCKCSGSAASVDALVAEGRGR